MSQRMSEDGRFFLPVRRERDGRDARIKPHYRGYGRSNEATHDRSADRLVGDVSRSIEREGGTVVGILSELELKRSIHAAIWEYRKEHYGVLDENGRQQIAEDHSLVVVDGKIMIPDAQLEVVRKSGDRERVNIEATSDHYRRSTIDRKRRAGFVMRDDPGRGRRVKDGPDIMGTMLSM